MAKAKNVYYDSSREQFTAHEMFAVLRFVLRPEKSFYRLAIIYGVCISLLTLALPVSVQTLINTVANTAMGQPVMVLAGVLFLLLMMNGIFYLSQKFLMERYKQRFFARITSRIALSSIYCDMENAEPRERLDIANRFFEIMTVQKNIPMLMTQGFALVLQTAVGLVLTSFYHPMIFVFNVILVMVVYFIWRVWGHRAIKQAVLLCKSKYKIAGWLEEISLAQFESRSESSINAALEKVESLTDDYIAARRALFRNTFAQSVAFVALYALASALLLGLGGWLVIGGELTLGQLVAAELILSAIFYGISRADYLLILLYELIAATEKLIVFFEPPKENETPRIASVKIAERPLLDIPLPQPLRTGGRILGASLVITVLLLIFIPWIQTSYGIGTITALNPDDRLQTINALTSGRINHWFVREGSKVKAGDPIVEIIDNDPQLMERLQAERDALQRKYDATQIAMDTALIDLNRQNDLFKRGLSARKEYEQATIKYKDLKSKEASAAAGLTKADVQLSRQATQVVRAPRDGTIIKVNSGDMATYVKAGDALATFVPDKVPQAVEIYASGLDAPLIYPGRKVRLMFEGWPAVQFSGWPSVAVGTFGGVVKVVDNSLSPGGTIRYLAVPDPEAEPWPSSYFLRFGAQAKGWVLLDEVSAGYEVWRQLNNFPPEFNQQVKHLATGATLAPTSAEKGK